MKRIICLTEETVETFSLLGRLDVVIGVSQYAVRPDEAKLIPKVSQFVKSDIDQIVSMKPDLVIGFSDIQQTIAKELIAQGLNVLVTNQRSLSEIFEMILLYGRLIDEGLKAQKLVARYQEKIEFYRRKYQDKKRKSFYFEEWDHPRYSCIQWVAELLEIFNLETIFPEKIHAMARGREVSDESIIERQPDIIFACWCGKEVKIPKITQRPGYEKIKAVQENLIFDLPPEIFLQPGPALFESGLDYLDHLLQKID